MRPMSPMLPIPVTDTDPGAIVTDTDTDATDEIQLRLPPIRYRCDTDRAQRAATSF